MGTPTYETLHPSTGWQRDKKDINPAIAGWNRLGGQLGVFWDNIAINHLSLNNSSMRSSFDTKLLLNRNTEQLIKSHFGQSGSMLNAIILPSNTSTATFDAQSDSVFAVPSTDVKEPLLDTEEKETIS